MSLQNKKQDMRAQARARRAGAHRAAGNIGPKLQAAFVAWAERSLPAGRSVAGYHPIRDEADVIPILAWLAERGNATCLPLTVGRERPLIFRQWSPGQPLVAGAMDIPEPPDSAPAIIADAFLVPLLAFDLAGGRLGYGAGHYDRTLAERDSRPLTIGVGYAAQLVDEVPMEPTDQRLDGVLTENGLAWVSPAPSTRATA